MPTPPPAKPPKTPARLRRWRLLVACAHALAWILVVVALAIGLVGRVPPLGAVMIGVHIVAGECGVWLLGLVVVAVALALVPPRRAPRTWVLGTVAVVAAALAAEPLVDVAPAARAADAEMARSCGPGWMDAIPAAQRAHLRPAPFSLHDALLGLPEAAVAVDAIAIPAGDGAPLGGLLYHDPAPTDTPRPIIVAFHGGGWRRGAVTEAAACNRCLAAHGWLVYAVDYRLAPGTHFPGQLDDARAALAWIRAHAGAAGGDPGRMVLMGRSAGAAIAMVAAFSRDEPGVRGVVAWYSPIDMATGVTHPSSPDPLDSGRLITDYLGARPEAEPARYAAASPLTYSARGAALPPLLVIAGVRDHVVLIGYQRVFHQRLTAAGATAALVELPWAEHACDLVPDGPSGQTGLYYAERFSGWAVGRTGTQPASSSATATAPAPAGPASP